MSNLYQTLPNTSLRFKNSSQTGLTLKISTIIRNVYFIITSASLPPTLCYLCALLWIKDRLNWKYLNTPSANMKY